MRVAAADEQRWNADALAGPVVRPKVAVWLYADTAIVLSRGQRRRIDEVRARSRCAVLARETGGAAVLTGRWMLSCSVLLPRDHPHGRTVRSAFAVVANAYLDAIAACAGRRCGARRAGDGDDAAAGVAWACFGTTAPHELVTSDGRKLVGLAQARRAAGTLVAGGLLLTAPPWELLSDAMSAPRQDASTLRARTATLEELCAAPRPCADAVARVLREALARRAA